MAIKSMKTDYEHFIESSKNEIELLSFYMHDRVLGIKGVCLLNVDNYVYCAIVMDLMQDGDLTRLTKQEIDIPYQQKIGLFREVCEGLAYLHSKNIIHRDIKPLNIFIRQIKGVWNAKIADLGISLILPQN